MTQPLFSIVTVTLNCAKEARQTAASVLSQQFSDYEYIVKDGGSTDGTLEAFRSLGVTQLISEPDGGTYDAMNRALPHCRGRFICFLNAGDEFAHEQVLARAAEYIKQFPQHSFFCGDLLTLEAHPLYGRGADGQGRVIAFPASFNRLTLFLLSVCQQTWFVKRELYEQHPLETSFSLNADHEFFMHWVTRQPDCYKHIPEIVARYAGGGQSEKQQALLRAQRRQLLGAYFSWPERAAFTGVQRLRQLYRVVRFYAQKAG